MAATNADDSMGVAVETLNAELNDILISRTSSTTLFMHRLILRASLVLLGLLTRVMQNLVARLTRIPRPPMGAWLLAASPLLARLLPHSSTQARPRG